MDRRQFLLNCFKIGGFAALMQLGIPYEEVKALVTGYSGPPVDGGTCSYTLKDNFADTQTNVVATFGDGTNIAAANVINNQTGGTYTAGRIVISLSKIGTPTGTLYCYIYTADTGGTKGPPDDRLATSETTIDLSTLASATQDLTFDFSTPATISNDNEKLVVIYVSGNTGDPTSNYLVFRGDGFISSSYGTYISATAPGETNDAANWTVDDNNGGADIATYQCD